MTDQSPSLPPGAAPGSDLGSGPPPPAAPLSGLGRLINRLTFGVSILGSIGIVLMMLHITAEVALRYLFNYVLPGTLIWVANYYMIFVVFLPFALLELRGRHLAVDVAYQAFPRRLQWVCACLAKALTVAVMALLSWAAWAQAVGKFRLGETVDQGTASVIVWPGYFALVAGCGLMTLVAALRLIELLMGRDIGLGPEAAE